MKLIHCADLHLGAKIDGFPKEISSARRQEVRNSFARMTEYAVKNGVAAILIAGDAFDRDEPFKKDEDFFYGLIERCPQIDFFYLRGNHDLGGEGRTLPNLHRFGKEWTYYDCGGVTICGAELSPAGVQSLPAALSLRQESKNIVLLHGQIGTEIPLARFRDKGVDYLALGHFHSYESGELDGRGVYAYSGCLEGRGFDETGEKGFVEIEIGTRVTHRFVPFSVRVIERVRVDVSGLTEGYAMARRAMEQTPFSRETIYRVELVGEVDAQVDEFAADVAAYLKRSCLFISVKDCTKKKIDYDAYALDVSVAGEFVRTVQQSEEYTDEEKAQIIAYGLRALSGREVDA